ncbi:MAG: hypothetical protein RR847_04745 [Bacilli bacterium]|uniref:hypothetical protein n=1 Tax=Anaerorhabdus sp. TaxID=1872524 RepID=UPI002FC93655
MKKIVYLLLIAVLTTQYNVVNPIKTNSLPICVYDEKGYDINHLCQELIIEPLSHEYGPD